MKSIEGNIKRPISLLEKTCITLLALCPILQHYKGVFINAAVTVLLLVFPYAIIRLYRKRFLYLQNIWFVMPLICFFIFKVIDHGTNVSELGQAVIFAVLVIAIACGCFDTKYFIRVITIVSVLASLLIMTQYVCYYVLHIHIQLVPISLLLDKSNQWVLAAKTGRASITGRVTKFYRPSSFFLEPSHMFIYLFTPLMLNLLSSESGKRELKISVIITMGMVLSTSGMGIMTAIGSWAVFFGMKGSKDEHFSITRYFRPATVTIILLGMATLVFMFFKVPFFQNSILRIVGSGSDYTNAISGRVSSGNALIGKLRGVELLIGVEDTLSGIEFNMSGFNATMYRYGIIGTIISYMFYLQGFYKLRGKYFWLAAVIVLLSFFSSHTHSTMFMIYSTFVYVDGYIEKKNKVINYQEVRNNAGKRTSSGYIEGSQAY